MICVTGSRFDKVQVKIRKPTDVNVIQIYILEDAHCVNFYFNSTDDVLLFSFIFYAYFSKFKSFAPSFFERKKKIKVRTRE